MLADPKRSAWVARSVAWTVAAVVLFWPLAIGAVLATRRAARAVEVHDEESAAREARDVRAHGLAAIAVCGACAVVATAVVVVGAGLVTRAAPAVQSLLAAGATTSTQRLPEPAEPSVVAVPEIDLGEGVSLTTAKPWYLLAPGDCFGTADLNIFVPLVACGSASAHHVFAAVPVPGPWPGGEQGSGAAEQACSAALAELGGLPRDAPYTLWHAAEEPWGQGQDVVVCAADPAVPSEGETAETFEGDVPADWTSVEFIAPPGCFDAAPLTGAGSLDVAPVHDCAEPHTGLVYAARWVDLTTDEPMAQSYADAGTFCAEEFRGLAARAPAGQRLEIWPVLPAADTPGPMTCAVTSDEPLPESLTDAARRR
ncbi:hypothetical protein LEP48_04185 [Isoptericola sp. NEAU-Y5]|uniref:Septum formation-related domain-containing protein n=1 Tax=Isoptericola luteus TaxID=2879484 RepID=A0ABS7ZDK9_9MICO|nr:hypothetical protein [Isoptericola sp. NEAU-Y5]MCA5892552.1 hypothetical protein [Isoptericola sp. NEAU-Y5]